MDDNDPMKKTLLYQLTALSDAWDDFIRGLAKATGIWWLLNKFNDFLKRHGLDD